MLMMVDDESWTNRRVIWLLVMWLLIGKVMLMIVVAVVVVAPVGCFAKKF